MTAAPATTAHLDLGGVTLTYVPDGELRADPRVAYPGGSDDIRADGLDVVNDDGMLVLSIGAVLVTTDTHRVLVDAGIGDRDVPIVLPGASRDGYMRGGALLRNLSALGVEPAEIDAVLLTHLHADHVGWLATDAGTPTFANAEHWVSEPEWRFWTGPEADGAHFGPRQQELAVIGARRRPLVDGAEPVPGITTVPTPGHTPGHSAFEVRGSSARAVIVGDAVHCPAEVLRPHLVWAGDLDGAAAVGTRHRIAAHVGDYGAVLVGPHFPNTVFLRYEQHPTPRLAPVAP